MTVLILIRHADTDYLGNRLAGRSAGVHLNSHGYQQAQTLAQTLANLPIKAIFCSPMERAIETAQPLAQILKLPIRIERELNEVLYGDLQGQTFKQLKRLKIWKLMHQSPSKVQLPGGESFIQVQQRAIQALFSVSSQFSVSDLLVCITHGDVIRLVLAHFLQMPLDFYPRLFIQTASLSVVSFASGIPTVLQVNHQPDQAICLPPSA